MFIVYAPFPLRKKKLLKQKCRMLRSVCLTFYGGLYKEIYQYELYIYIYMNIANTCSQDYFKLD
jgi:hypothetical protein